MTKPKTLEQFRADKERAETQLAQEQHKLERLENRKKYLEQGVQAAISTETEKITQPSGAATPSGAPTTKPQMRQSLPFYPLATQGFRNVWNAPRVVIPPPPRTFRKYCAQSEKTATSPSCKQITQPSGAATPRNSDAHKRIAVPKAFCVLQERLRPSPKSGKTCRSGTRPGDVGERAERSESSDTTPIRNAPCFAV